MLDAAASDVVPGTISEHKLVSK